MCGIAGIFSPQGQSVDQALLVRMTRALRHRGPDDEGYLFADSRSNTIETRRGSESIPEIKTRDVSEVFSTDFRPNLGLGWRRLSIIDLSPTGHQPMANEEQTVWIIFNGEIYNYIELREELRAKGYTFRTQSDTEVIIRSYEQWGTDCLQHLNGMWAFSLYDVRRKLLFCARDRFGIKPFYYTWDGTTLAFASEIKSLLESPAIQRTANDAMVYDYLFFCILDHTEQTFFKEINQLRPGHFLQVDTSGLKVQQYYSLPYSPELGRFEETHCRRYAERFRELFTESVRIHLRTDVTLGSCLSGGLDSSSIVCTANQLIFGEGLVDRSLIGDKQKTFTASYNDERYSEDRFVRRVIETTNAAAHFIRPTSRGLMDELQRFIHAHDEPVISTSMYAQWNVMKLAAQHKVRVLLDGQGGDELLAGYRWHYPVFHANLLRQMRFGELVSEVRKTAAVTGESFQKLLALKLLKNFVPKDLRDGLYTIKTYLNKEFTSALGQARNSISKSDFNLQQRLWEEETRYNLTQLLHYEDRNSMAFSIEARIPFVNYRVVEYVMNVPAMYKIHDGWSKYLLRRATEGILPDDIRWRKDKMGFVTPEEEWMRELRTEFSSLLLKEPIRSRRFLDETKFPKELSSGRIRLSSGDVWRLLNLELWMRTFNVA